LLNRPPPWQVAEIGAAGVAVGDLLRGFFERGLEGGAGFGRGEAVARVLAIEERDGRGRGGFQERGERFGAAGAEDVVGVLALRGVGDFERAAGREVGDGEIDGFVGGALAGGVAVIAEDRLAAGAPEELQLFLGERGAARGDGGDAGALEGDDVEIAFADDKAVGFGFREQFARLLEAIEHAALGIER
jgi:hypothetical protein